MYYVRLDTGIWKTRICLTSRQVTKGSEPVSLEACRASFDVDVDCECHIFYLQDILDDPEVSLLDMIHSEFPSYEISVSRNFDAPDIWDTEQE